MEADDLMAIANDIATRAYENNDNENNDNDINNDTNNNNNDPNSSFGSMSSAASASLSSSYRAVRVRVPSRRSAWTSVCPAPPPVPVRRQSSASTLTIGMEPEDAMAIAGDIAAFLRVVRRETETENEQSENHQNENHQNHESNSTEPKQEHGGTKAQTNGIPKPTMSPTRTQTQTQTVTQTQTQTVTQSTDLMAIANDIATFVQIQQEEQEQRLREGMCVSGTERDEDRWVAATDSDRDHDAKPPLPPVTRAGAKIATATANIATAHRRAVRFASSRDDPSHRSAWISDEFDAAQSVGPPATVERQSTMSITEFENLCFHATNDHGDPNHHRGGATRTAAAAAAAPATPPNRDRHRDDDDDDDPAHRTPASQSVGPPPTVWRRSTVCMEADDLMAIANDIAAFVRIRGERGCGDGDDPEYHHNHETNGTDDGDDGDAASSNKHEREHEREREQQSTTRRETQRPLALLL